MGGQRLSKFLTQSNNKRIPTTKEIIQKESSHDNHKGTLDQINMKEDWNTFMKNLNQLSSNIHSTSEVSVKPSSNAQISHQEYYKLTSQSEDVKTGIDYQTLKQILLFPMEKEVEKTNMNSYHLVQSLRKFYPKIIWDSTMEK